MSKQNRKQDIQISSEHMGLIEKVENEKLQKLQEEQAKENRNNRLVDSLNKIYRVLEDISDKMYDLRLVIENSQKNKK